MTGLESSYKGSSSQAAPVDIPATQQGTFGESLDSCDFASVDFGVGPMLTVADSNMETGIEVDEGSSFSLFQKKDHGFGLNWGSLSSIKRSLFFSLFLLQVPAPIRNEASNEAEDALVIDRGTGLPVVLPLIMGRRRALQLPNDTARADRDQVRRLGAELRGLGDMMGRDAAAGARRTFLIPTGRGRTTRTGPTAAAVVIRQD